MEAKEMADMSDEEIVAQIAQLSDTLRHYRFQKALGQLDPPSKMRVARRQVARLKTALRARQLKASVASA